MNKFICFLLFSMIPILDSFAQQNPLPDCPKSPNCFRSETNTKRSVKMPLTYSSDLKTAQEKLIQLLAAYPGAKYEGTEGETVAFSFTTGIGKFVDKVTFYFDQENKLIHFRSASQVGWSDMGANKRRMKKVRKLWLET